MPATILNTGRKERNTKMEKKKPYSVVPVQQIHDGHREARPVPRLFF
jgi:hypothetical protein